jgi:hypothetical protein
LLGQVGRHDLFRDGVERPLPRDEPKSPAFTPWAIGEGMSPEKPVVGAALV